MTLDHHVWLEITPISDPPELPGGGLHWFRIEFADREGHCFITTGEAQRLKEMSSDWVERALRNLAAKHGREWIKEWACSSPGLVLHHSDA